MGPPAQAVDAPGALAQRGSRCEFGDDSGQVEIHADFQALGGHDHVDAGVASGGEQTLVSAGEQREISGANLPAHHDHPQRPAASERLRSASAVATAMGTVFMKHPTVCGAASSPEPGRSIPITASAAAAAALPG